MVLQGLQAQPTERFQGKAFGKSINTSDDEFAPVFSSSGRKIFFVRSKPSNERGHDIWFTAKKRGRWMPPKRLNKAVNGQAANGLGGLSYNGKTLYITNIYDEFGNVTGTGISRSQRSGYEWKAPEAVWDASELPIKGGFGFHAVEGEEEVIFLSMQDTTQGFGAEDLYVMVKQDSGFSQPQNLGDLVNTEGAELSPFIANSGRLLFFASNGHGGQGNVDIFMSRRTGDRWTDWSRPINLGEEVNTPDFDAYFALDTAGKRAVFSSAPSPEEWGNLYIVDADKIPALRDSVPRATVTALVDTVAEEQETEEEAPAIAKTDSAATQMVEKDTATAAVEPEEETVTPETTAEVTAQVPSNSDTSKRVYEEIYEAVVNRKDLVFDNVLFDFNDYKLRPSEKDKVDRMVEFMEEHPDMRLKLNGHTDAVGSDSINVIFGNARCVSIRNYISLKGISPKRVEIYSFGEKQPLEGSAAINRRVEVFLIKPEEE